MASKTYRRHPAEVTADRLGDHSERYYDLMNGVERDALPLVRFVLEQIADGERGAQGEGRESDGEAKNEH